MLYASFIRPEGIYNSFFNKAAAFVTKGDFCHSEFIFKWSEEELQEILKRVKGCSKLKYHKGDINVCVYVIWGDKVRYRILSDELPSNNPCDSFWRMPQNDLIEVNTDWESEKNMFTWLMAQMGAPYDKTGAVLSVVPWRAKSSAYDKYFCSQLMCCALQRIGVMELYNPASVSPNDLYRVLHTRA